MRGVGGPEHPLGPQPGLASAASIHRRSSSVAPRAPGGRLPRRGPGRPVPAYGRPNACPLWRSGSRCPRPPRSRPTSSTVVCMARRMASVPSVPVPGRSWLSDGAEQGRAPAAVAARRTEPSHLRSRTTIRSAGVGAQPRMGRPQSGEPGADDGHVDVEVPRQRRPGAMSPSGVPPQRQSAPVAGVRRHPRPLASDPAPRLANTSRSTWVMKSISAGSQISGGESWTTGSPRSSARQIRPASKRAPER